MQTRRYFDHRVTFVGPLSLAFLSLAHTPSPDHTHFKYILHFSCSTPFSEPISLHLLFNKTFAYVSLSQIVIFVCLLFCPLTVYL